MNRLKATEKLAQLGKRIQDIAQEFNIPYYTAFYVVSKLRNKGLITTYKLSPVFIVIPHEHIQVVEAELERMGYKKEGEDV